VILCGFPGSRIVNVAPLLQPTFAADAFVKAYSRAGGFLEEITKTFD